MSISILVTLALLGVTGVAMYGHQVSLQRITAATLQMEAETHDFQSKLQTARQSSEELRIQVRLDGITDSCTPRETCE